MKSGISALILLVQCYFAVGQLIYSFHGVRNNGYGGASSHSNDIQSVNANPSGLTQIENFQIALSSESRYLGTGISITYIAVAFPTNSASFGASASYAGYKRYYESSIGLAVGKSILKKFALGIGANLHNTHIPGFNSINFLTTRVGIQYHPIQKLTIGVCLLNPFYYRNNQGIEPSFLQIGFSYRLSSVSMIVAEVENSVTAKPIFRTGFEISFKDNVWLRFGTSSFFILNLGIGFRYHKLKTDISIYNHDYLGQSVGLSVTYEFSNTSN